MVPIDPVQRVALPRFLAGLISVPLLTAMFNALAILGSVIFAVGVAGLDGGIFWTKLQTGVYFGQDFIGGVWKSLVFGGIVSLVAVFFGYTSKPTGAGVGTATTNTVVLSSVLIDPSVAGRVVAAVLPVRKTSLPPNTTSATLTPALPR